MDIGNEKTKRIKNILETTKILVKMMRLETWELRRKMMSKKWDSANSEFPSIINLFESERDMEECNLP